MADISVTWEEIKEWEKESYVWIDLREEEAIAYGGIPGALWIPLNEIEDRTEELPKDKRIVLYCMRGVLSVEVAEKLRDTGLDAYSLQCAFPAVRIPC